LRDRATIFIFDEVLGMSIAGFSFPDIWNAMRAIGQAIGQAMVTGPDRIALYLVWATVVFAALFTFWQTREPGSGFRGFLRHFLPAGLLIHA
jgi:hypothetical protein